MNIAEFMQVMEGIAPQETAEPWDNPGLLAGDPKACLLYTSTKLLDRRERLKQGG